MLEYYEIGEEVRVEWYKDAFCAIMEIEDGYPKDQPYYAVYIKDEVFHGVPQNCLRKVYTPSETSFQDLLRLCTLT